jgi:hypothetical protein
MTRNNLSTEGLRLTSVLGLGKNRVTRNLCQWDCTSVKIPHLSVHKPKPVVVETVLLISMQVGDPLYYSNFLTNRV